MLCPCCSGSKAAMLNALPNVTELRSNLGFEPVWMTPFLHDVNDFLEITCFGKPTAAMLFTCHYMGNKENKAREKSLKLTQQKMGD